MDVLDAFEVVRKTVVESGNEEAIRALRLLMTPAPPIPPSRLGALGGSAYELAQLVHRTGVRGAWQTPPAHSEAMERLAHRLTDLLSCFLDLAEEARQAQQVKPVPSVVWPSVDVDELYQISLCDDCGAQLPPSGACLTCSGIIEIKD